MSHYDDKLRTLQEKTDRCHHLRALLTELYSQRCLLEEQLSELESIKISEQADVNRLEGRSLAAFFYNVIGKMDEQLDKERREAYAARVKYDAAARELEAVIREIDDCEAEVFSLEGCEAQFEAALREKAEALKASGSGAAHRIFELEQAIFALRSREKELGEAIAAGETAYDTACQILSSLDSAEGWGTFDLLGGGFIADLAKHSHLDEAQAAVETLQTQLRRFKTELSDVSLSADIKVNIDGFLGFADFFFDGLFVDWAVMDEISRSRLRVAETADRINSLISHLHLLTAETRDEIGRRKKEMDELIINS